MKKYLIPTIIILFLITLFFLKKGVSAKEINVESKKIEYSLPYAGLLPSHPLYGFKELRDNIWVFMTRDYVKKARLLLLISDKKIVMASKLSDNGQWERAAEIAEESEKDFLKIFSLLEKAEKQGASAADEFVEKLRPSNRKHKEMIESILSDLPSGSHKKFQEVLKINSQIKSKIDAL